MDNLDHNLIKLLEQDALQGSEALAQKLCVSPVTVRRRQRALIEEDIIRIVAVVDPEKIGYHLTTIIGLSVSHDTLEADMETLVSFNEVKWVTRTTGRYDVMIGTVFYTTHELSTFLSEKLTILAGLKDSEVFVCIQLPKGRYMRI